jgi:hypothetical protein
MASIINRTAFFDGYRKEFKKYGGISQSQVDNLNYLLDRLDESTSIDSLAKYSYVLATIFHETAGTYAPIKEYGSDSYLKSKSYWPYVGRGFCMITWKANYKKFGDALNLDLVNTPELAQIPINAWKILELGMTNRKTNFTGKILDDFINDNTINFIGARKIINGTDKATLVGNYADAFFSFLEFTYT